MRKLYFILFLSAIIIACTNNKVESSHVQQEDSIGNNTASLPYPVAKAPDWEKGKDANIAVAMGVLKAFETNNMTDMQKLLADTVVFYDNNGRFEGTRDSFTLFLKKQRDAFTNVSVNMLDYEAVQSKSRNEEWVSLWYTLMRTGTNGKTDSIMVMEDVKMEGGKVAEMDNKTRRMPQQASK